MEQEIIRTNLDETDCVGEKGCCCQPTLISI